jgi:hypothetical protein
MKKISDMEYSRNNRIVEEVMNFDLCVICENEDDNLTYFCTKNCGKKIVRQCMPAIEKYGGID